MVKTIAWISLVATVYGVPLSAHAQTGTASNQARHRPRLSTGRGTAPTKARTGRELAQNISVAAADTTICITTTLSERSGLFAWSQGGLATPALDSTPADPIDRDGAFWAAMGP